MSTLRLVVKGPKWLARVEAAKRGIVWDEDDPYNPPKPLQSSAEEALIHCSKEYSDRVYAWFREPVRRGVGEGFPNGTLLYFN